MVGALGPQPVGHREAAVEVAHVECGDRGQLVDDHIGPRLGDGIGDLLGIERVDDHRRGPEVRQRRLLGLAPRGADDLVAGGDQPGDQLFAHRACRACNEDFHFRLLILDCTSSDEVAPAAVTTGRSRAHAQSGAPSSRVAI